MRQKLAILIALTSLLACEREEVGYADRYVRNYGLEGNSSFTDITETANGNLVLCGQISKPAFNSNLSSEFSSSDLEESSPALVLTNREGEVLDYHLFPISNLDIDPIIRLSDLRGKAKFLEVQALSNGGYLIHGEFRNFGFSIGFNAPDPEPQSSNTIPFLALVNANFELEKFINFNGEAPWDGFLRGIGRLVPKPNKEGYVFMIGFNFRTSTNQHLGFRLYDIGAAGEIIGSHDFYDISFDKYARDLCFLENGEIAVAGIRAKVHTYFKVNPNSFSQEGRIALGHDGTSERINNNYSLVEPLPGGGMMFFYTDPVEITYIHILDADGNTLLKEDLEPNRIDQYPINSSVCANGDVLLTCSDLEDPVLERARVYRISPDGSIRWTKLFDGRVQSITEASDGDLYVLVDLLYGAGTRKATLFKLDPNGALY